MAQSGAADYQAQLDALIVRVLDYYKLQRPPVPIERMLAHPIEGLQQVDMTDLSLVFGIGEHRDEYRMAMGRLLYREICRQGPSGWAAQEYPYSTEAARYFAASLLVPSEWLLKAVRRPLINVATLSETYQVPDYVVATRVAQIGKRVRGM